MKTITVNWTDAELNDHQFVMDVDEHQNIDSLVKEKVFDEAVANYEWNGASDLTRKMSDKIAELLTKKDIRFRVVKFDGIYFQFELINYYGPYSLFTINLWKMKFMQDFEGKAYNHFDIEKSLEVKSMLENALFKYEWDEKKFKS